MDYRLSEVETEVVLLKAVNEIIDSIVNFEVLRIVGKDPDSEIRFQSTTHRRFFNIVLVDFLSTTDEQIPLNKTSYLRGLRSIVKSPAFDVGDSVGPLRIATSDFVAWLEQEIEVDVWLPSIEVETRLKVTRVDFIKMCGNVSKHNFLRAGGVAKELQVLLSNSGVSATLGDALLALSDFYVWFHTDILAYHSSTITEFLNEIRWGIHEYLQPEYQRSFEWTKPPGYKFNYPAEVVDPFAKACYWDLMNEIRAKPYLRRFKVTKYLKMRY